MDLQAHFREHIHQKMGNNDEGLIYCSIAVLHHDSISTHRAPPTQTKYNWKQNFKLFPLYGELVFNGGMMANRVGYRYEHDVKSLETPPAAAPSPCMHLVHFLPSIKHGDYTTCFFVACKRKKQIGDVNKHWAQKIKATSFIQCSSTRVGHWSHLRD